MVIIKKVIIFLVLLIPVLVYGQSTYRVTYDLTYQIDSTNISSLQSEQMLLDFAEDISVFKSNTTHLKDSILKSNHPHSLFGVAKSDFLYKIYKTNGKLVSLYDYTTYKYELKEDLPDLKWNLHEDTKTILDYECKLATTSFAGRDYSAWYVLEIPISDGPYKFYGLPGLILEIYDTQNHYHFEAIGITKLHSKIRIKNEEYREISVKEYEKFLENIKQKPSLILNNPGIQVPKASLDKYDRNHRERNKIKNNPIELIK